MKLTSINESSGLQPLPASVHADVSQSVSGSTTGALPENRSSQEQSSQTVQQSVAQQITSNIPQLSFSGFSPLWILFIVAIVIVAAVVWLWRSF